MGIRDEVPLYSDLPGEEVQGRRVLVRSDLNDPIEERLDREAELYRDVVAKGGRLVIMAHRGRYGENKSLEDATQLVSDKIDRHVLFIGDCIGPEVLNAINDLEEDEAALLESTRMLFADEDYAKSPDNMVNMQLAEGLARNGDFLVFNGFGVSHRKNASTTGVVERMESYAGPLLVEEVEQLEPFKGAAGFSVAAIGGAKLKEKMAAMRLPYQAKIPGGLVLNCMLRARGYRIAASPTKEKGKDYTAEAGTILHDAGDAVLLPATVLVSRPEGEGYEEAFPVPIDRGVPDDYMIVDFIPSEEMCEALQRAERALMAGSLSLYEGGFINSSEVVAELMNSVELSIAIGADTVKPLKCYSGRVCTGGGAGLTYLGGMLPVLEALKAKKS